MNFDKNMTVQDYWAMVLRRKWLVIIPTVIFFVGAVAYAFLAPEIYQASTDILMETPKIPTNYISPTVEKLERQIDSIAQQIRSRNHLEQIVRDLNLFDEDNEEESIAIMTSNLRQNITIRAKVGSIFTIVYQGSDPKEVEVVANKIAAIFIEETRRIRGDQAHGTTAFLEEELEKLKHTLEEQEEAIRRFKKIYLGELPEQKDTILHTLTSLQETVKMNHSSIRELRYRRSQFETDISEMVQSGEVLPREMRLNNLKDKLEQTLMVYTDKYPDVIQLKKEIAELEESITGGGTGAAAYHEEDSDNPRYKNLVRQLQDLDFRIKTFEGENWRISRQATVYQKRLDSMPQREEELATLTRDYQNTKENYERLLNKKIEATLSENMEQRQQEAKFKVLEAAIMPDAPISPKRPQVILIGLLLGLSCGLGMAFLREYSDPTFKDVEELQKIIDVPILASIPRIESSTT